MKDYTDSHFLKKMGILNKETRSVSELVVIGGGLAGCEAAWQAAIRGISVRLYEMRPVKNTPAHKTGDLAELVCSNSFGARDPFTAPGLLKEEMRALNSLILSSAESASVPAGAALGIDRVLFSQAVNHAISKHPNITVTREEATEIPDKGIIATGPLTSDRLAATLQTVTASESLYFFDAISPIIDAASIDLNIVFRASRYGKGGEDYLNCPMNETEYNRFYEALMGGERVPAKEFERTPYFEGCLPIEVLAERGKQTPVFGPMKPVGLIDPKTGKRPYAVVQLRAENRYGSAYNMVGFQTKLKWPEQKRIFTLIPGLEKAEFLRLGSIHRNTFVNAPRVLSNCLQVRTRPGLFMAGQLIGVEGYVESAAMGGLAGIYAARTITNRSLSAPTPTTAHGALITHITESSPTFFQPMNIHFGLFPPARGGEATGHVVAGNITGIVSSKATSGSRGLGVPVGTGSSPPHRGKAKRRYEIVCRAQRDFQKWIQEYGILDDILK